MHVYMYIHTYIHILCILPRAFLREGDWPPSPPEAALRCEYIASAIMIIVMITIQLITIILIIIPIMIINMITHILKIITIMLRQISVLTLRISEGLSQA